MREYGSLDKFVADKFGVSLAIAYEIVETAYVQALTVEDAYRAVVEG